MVTRQDFKKQGFSIWYACVAQILRLPLQVKENIQIKVKLICLGLENLHSSFNSSILPQFVNPCFQLIEN
jgi:hypothetical protein